MKSSAITRIVLCSIAIVLLTAILVGGIGVGIAFQKGAFNSSLNFTFDLPGGKVESSGAVSAADVKNLEINWVAGSITIQPGDVSDIQFSEGDGISGRDKMVWALQGDTLCIQFCKARAFSFSFFNFGKTSVPKHLVITVPQDWLCVKLNINSASARLNVTALSAGSANLKNVSGVCAFNQCDIGSLTCETVSGDIRYNGTLSSLECDSVSAICEAELSNTPDSIRMNGVSGDLRLTLPEDTGFVASLDSLSGKITCDFPAVIDGDYLYGDQHCRITVDGVSGNVIIKKASK